MPLSLVTRLEEFDVSAVEKAGAQHLVQYRGKLMPLVYASEQKASAQQGVLPMLVFADGDRVMGLVVDRIVDIVEDRLELQIESQRPGYLGSAIIRGRATEVLDIGHYLPMAFPDWLGERGQLRKLKLLYAEDSPFFRNMTLPVLMSAGFEVTAVEDGAEALKLIKAGGAFDLVVTDIEMPNMDGFALTRAIRNNPQSSGWPVVALSAFTGP